MRGEVAGIVDLAGGGLVGHRLRRNEILAPDRVGRHPEFARGGIDQSLDHVGRFGTAGAAIGIDRHGIGEHRADPAMEGLDVVEPRQHVGAAMRNVGAEGREIRAHVAHQVAIHRQKLAVGGERHPRRGDVVAALRVAHEMIGAIGGPFHGLAQLSRGDRDQRVFAIGKQLGAETAADIRADYPHLFDRDLQHVLAQDIAQPVAALAADRQRQMIAPGVVFADRRAGLHEIGDDARIDDRNFGNRMRLGKRRIGRLLVADGNVEQHIAGMIGPDLRRALLDRVGEADHRRQRRPVDLDRLDRIAGLIDGIGDDKGYGIADMADFAFARIGYGGPVKGSTSRLNRQGRSPRSPTSAAVRMRRRPAGRGRASHRWCIWRARAASAAPARASRPRRVVVGVAALAADQCVVFLAQHALTDAEFDGSHLISDSRDFAPYCSGSRASANDFSRAPATDPDPNRTAAGSIRHRRPRRTAISSNSSATSCSAPSCASAPARTALPTGSNAAASTDASDRKFCQRSHKLPVEFEIAGAHRKAQHQQQIDPGSDRCGEREADLGQRSHQEDFQNTLMASPVSEAFTGVAVSRRA